MESEMGLIKPDLLATAIEKSNKENLKKQNEFLEKRVIRIFQTSLEKQSEISESEIEKLMSDRSTRLKIYQAVLKQLKSRGNLEKIIFPFILVLVIPPLITFTFIPKEGQLVCLLAFALVFFFPYVLLCSPFNDYVSETVAFLKERIVELEKPY